MKRIFARAFRAFHIWAGLTLGGLFCLLSLSGSVLVLRPLIEEILRPAWKRASLARPARVLTEAANNIGHQWPGSVIESMTFAEDFEIGIRTATENSIRVYADPRSGELLGTFALPWLDWVTDLHHHLQIPSAGKQIVGFIGVGLFLSSLTGLLLWALRSRPWKRLWSPRAGSARRLTQFDWHRSLGVFGNVLLLFVSATGIITAFPQTIARLLGVPAPSVKADRRAGKRTTSAAAVSVEDYGAAALQAISGGTLRQLRFPPTNDRPVIARVKVRGDLEENGSIRILFRPGTAQIMTVDSPREWPLSKRVVQAAKPLHYAEWGGVTLRLLWSLIGLIPPGLFASGIVMWWIPVRARRRAGRMVAARALSPVPQ